MSVLKRQREVKKAEKAALKRERREQRTSENTGEGTRVATREELEGYGSAVEDEGEAPAETDQH